MNVDGHSFRLNPDITARHILPRIALPPSLPIGSAPYTRANVTHPRLHIRNMADALVVLEAVRRRLLRLITVRLSGSERDELQAGNVFVWEESDEDGGLVRWTDGRRWSQSRVVGDSLFYQEKIEMTDAEKDAKALRRAQRVVNPSLNLAPPPRNKRPGKSDGLTKQTYSFQVVKQQGRRSCKWHLVAYTRLPVLEDYDVFADIRAPEGVFSKSRTAEIPPDARSEPRTPPTPYSSRPLGHRWSQQINGYRRDEPVAAPQLPSSIIFDGEATGQMELESSVENLNATPRATVALEPHAQPVDVVSQEGRRILDALRIRI
ncbi:hypothetical protein MIND_00564500 [Mycena indigotica]|uniref:cAMP-independent regulatory protein pac2 n=1 Tax=Mycena indigotica TaxID=2126181 RepID=A0A8H6SR34_9AGAR|nr:uncharacterized protein MIND_00564500 [Mycena indigotica]KAF7303367.1 hypothetical protein MIND_00564500 [Mycena indigotica]